MKLLKLYQQFLRHYGPQGWWPVSSRNKNGEAALFEICVGAILTQNAAWTNVEKALGSLRHKKLLSARAINQTKPLVLGQVIKSSGYWRQKTKKLKIFSAFLLKNYRGSLKKMFRRPLEELRGELLALWGIGPETADSMLLYAGQRPVFVIDAYTKRLCQKYGVCFKTYLDYQKFFERQLSKIQGRAKVKLFNEFHALIVRWGKNNSNVKSFK